MMKKALSVFGSKKTRLYVSIISFMNIWLMLIGNTKWGWSEMLCKESIFWGTTLGIAFITGKTVTNALYAKASSENEEENGDR
jgi:hypothetical protein